jgi:hypothetical protein
MTTLAQLGFATGDLDGKYFKQADYTFSITNGGGAAQPTYTITVGPSTAAEGPTTPATEVLDNAGTFTP